MSVYNSSTYLKEAVDSVLNQSFNDFEFIIVDDGSTDPSAEILASYVARDARIVILTQSNQGLPAALNAGIAAARSEVIARMDADDVMLPDRLAKQLPYLQEHPEAAVVSCLAHYINDRGKVLGKNYTDLLTVADCQRYLAEGKIIFCLHPGAMFRKQAVTSIGGYRPAMVYAQDIDLWNRLADQGHYTIVMPEILMRYRIHPEASMAKAGRRDIVSKWVTHCAYCRRRGEPEPSLDAFQRQLDAAPRWQRIKRKRRLYRTTYYRNAGMMFGSRRYGRFVGYLLLASVLSPGYVFFKLKQQVFSKGSFT
jgi:glycosyltransferase involved in cell wall biosynthesis